MTPPSQPPAHALLVRRILRAERILEVRLLTPNHQTHEQREHDGQGEQRPRGVQHGGDAEIGQRQPRVHGIAGELIRPVLDESARAAHRDDGGVGGSEGDHPPRHERQPDGHQQCAERGEQVAVRGER